MSLRQERERPDMPRPDRSEVTPINRGDFDDVQAFSDGYDGCVHKAQREVYRGRSNPSARISSTRSDTSSADPSAIPNHDGGHTRGTGTASTRDRNADTTAGTCSSGNRSTSSRNSSRGPLTRRV